MVSLDHCVSQILSLILCFPPAGAGTREGAKKEVGGHCCIADTGVGAVKGGERNISLQACLLA